VTLSQLAEYRYCSGSFGSVIVTSRLIYEFVGFNPIEKFELFDLIEYKDENDYLHKKSVKVGDFYITDNPPRDANANDTYACETILEVGQHYLYTKITTINGTILYSKDVNPNGTQVFDDTIDFNKCLSINVRPAEVGVSVVGLENNKIRYVGTNNNLISPFYFFVTGYTEDPNIINSITVKIDGVIVDGINKFKIKDNCYRFYISKGNVGIHKIVCTVTDNMAGLEELSFDINFVDPTPSLQWFAPDNITTPSSKEVYIAAGIDTSSKLPDIEEATFVFDNDIINTYKLTRQYYQYKEITSNYFSMLKKFTPGTHKVQVKVNFMGKQYDTVDGGSKEFVVGNKPGITTVIVNGIFNGQNILPLENGEHSVLNLEDDQISGTLRIKAFIDDNDSNNNGMDYNHIKTVTLVIHKSNGEIISKGTATKVANSFIIELTNITAGTYEYGLIATDIFGITGDEKRVQVEINNLAYTSLSVTNRPKYDNFTQYEPVMFKVSAKIPSSQNSLINKIELHNKQSTDTNFVVCGDPRVYPESEKKVSTVETFNWTPLISDTSFYFKGVSNITVGTTITNKPNGSNIEKIIIKYPTPTAVLSLEEPLSYKNFNVSPNRPIGLLLNSSAKDGIIECNVYSKHYRVGVANPTAKRCQSKNIITSNYFSLIALYTDISQNGDTYIEYYAEVKSSNNIVTKSDSVWVEVTQTPSANDKNATDLENFCKAMRPDEIEINIAFPVVSDNPLNPNTLNNNHSWILNNTYNRYDYNFGVRLTKLIDLTPDPKIGSIDITGKVYYYCDAPFLNKEAIRNFITTKAYNGNVGTNFSAGVYRASFKYNYEKGVWVLGIGLGLCIPPKPPSIDFEIDYAEIQVNT
jgi:hypothetical protein